MLLFLFPIENSQRANYFFGYRFGCWLGFFFRKSFQVQTDLSASVCELVRLTLSAGARTSEEVPPFHCTPIPTI